MSLSTLSKPASWITYAENDLDSEQALRLCSSIRASPSTKEISIIIGAEVSKKVVAALEVSFNNVIRAARNELEELGQLSMDVKLSLLAWKVCSCKKAVFLQPNSVVLANCDELFDAKGDFCAVPTTSTNAAPSRLFKTAVLVFKPNKRIFKEMTAQLNNIGNSRDNDNQSETSNGFETCQLTLSEVLSFYFGVRLNSELEIRVSSEIDGCGKESLKLLSVEKLPSLDEEERNSSGDMPESTNKNEPIAIVGLSCRFPDADNESEFWDLLYEGRDATKLLPGSRHFTRKANMDNDDEMLDVPAGYLKCPVDEFDAKFFHISRREAEYMDPQQRLLLEVSWESLENAGINPHSLKDSNTAVFMGIWAQEYGMLLDQDNQTQNFHFRYLGNALCAASARISHFLGLRGRSVTMESGCASALEAVHFACESLHNGTTDLVISGGVNVALNSGQTVAGFDSFILSKDGKCKTFDKDANGFARGEACVVLILKRLSDALKDGNDILGVIRGSAVNSDGAGSSLGTPNAVAQEQAVRAALRKAGVQPHEISYVEAHGTGTPVGDPLEFHSLNCVFGNDPNRTQPLIVGSVKTIIGHTEGASGASGLVKVLLAMKHRTIPKHLNLVELNPYIDLKKIPAVIPQDRMAWNPCSSQGLLAGLSSFGLSGTNVHMIIQEPPKQTEYHVSNHSDRTNHILVLSANSEEARADLVDRYVALIESNSKIPLADLAFSANTGRGNLPYRLALIAEDSGQALSRLQKGQFHSGKVSSLDHKIGFLFTGQGSQYVAMAKELYDTHPFFKFRFDQCNDLLTRYSPELDLKLLLSYSPSKMNCNLDDSFCSQPAIFCIEYCLAELWRSFGIFPDYVLGHSVGEFAAAVVAGVISFEDGLKLVVERSRLLDRLPNGSMIVMRASVDGVRKLLTEFQRENLEFWADIAAVNSIDEVVLSGLTEPINAFQESCKSKYEINSQKLNASHAFHSRAIDPILEDYERIASTVKYGKSLVCQFISGAMAKEMLVGQFDSKYWVSHFRESVHFVDAFNLLRREKCDVFVEIGPQPVLLGLGMSLISSSASGVCTWCPSIRRTESNWITMLTSLCRMYGAGVAVDWFGFDSAYQRKRIRLPNYSFQREKYWFCSKSRTTDSLVVNSKLLHPLLGRRIPSPKAEVVSYYNSIDLNKIPYLRDHKVENVVILPAAGYLEMILAAGSDTIGGGFNCPIPLTMEGLVIEAALVLIDDCPTQLQTTMNMLTDEDGQIKYAVSVYKQTLFDVSGSDSGKWRKMASASFIPTASMAEINKTSIDLSMLKGSLTQRQTVVDIYAKLAETGINFGPLFKSIQDIWYSETEILVETSLPEFSSRYVCHPIVLDAMIQCSAATLAMSPGALQGLHLPISIRKFVALPNIWTPKLFMLIQRQNDDISSNRTNGVTLYNENGEFMAVMEGLDHIGTTVDSFLKSIQADEDIYPTFFDESWKWQSSPNANRVDSNAVALCDFIHQQVVEGQKDITYGTAIGLSKKEEGELFGVVDELSYLYILRSIREIGGADETVAGSTFSLDNFKRTASVLPEHGKLLRRWIQILEEEGDIEFQDEDNMRVLRTIPDAHEIDLRIQQCIPRFKGDARLIDCQYIINFGEHLTELIQGKMSPFSLLFPESKDKVGAAAFYNFSVVVSGVHQLLATEFGKALAEQIELTHITTRKTTVLRLLEVGGGSGSLTGKFVKELDESGIRYEYTFTDISPLLLQMATVRFGDNKNMKFKLLDIESDPKTQGFAPHSFDIVLADNVLHATLDLKRTLRNVRHLLVPNGFLMLVEIVNRSRLLDVSFGFTSGWWRFTDFDVRHDYPCVNRETWAKLLVSQGFQKPLGIMDLDVDRRSKVSLDAFVVPVDDELSTLPALDETIRSVWLLFGGLDHMATQCLKDRLESSGQLVMLVHMSKMHFINPEENQCGVRVHDADDYCQLLNSLVARDCKLAGVVYLWGMITDAKYTLQNCALTNHDECLSELTNGLLYLTQAMCTTSLACNVFLVTVGMQTVNDAEFISKNPVSHILNGMMSAIGNELFGYQFVCIDIQRECELQHDLMINACKDVFDQLWLQDQELQVAFRNGNKFVKRLTLHEQYRPSLVLPNSERFRLKNPGTGKFSDFNIAPCPKLDLSEEQVEVRVNCAALNFKDVLVALNAKELRSDKEQTTGLPDFISELGLDFAGTVTRVGNAVQKFRLGDNVVGMTAGDLGGSLASHVVVPAAQIRHMRAGLSFESSSTLGAVLFTVHHFLIQKANIKTGDKVLIHCASGGVGLFAVQTAHYFGAEVFATAGSERKRNYLRQFMNVQHVYNSRDTNFGQEILRDTNGYGVDIVLNALTGQGFKETSLSICAPKARFLEMSKINVWTEDEIRALRPDVVYAIQDISKLDASEFMAGFGDPDEIFNFHEEFCASEKFKELPYTLFTFSRVHDAFRYLRKAKHIGKVVVKMPTTTIQNGQILHSENLFNEFGSYLITGGLGGIGLEVAKWMAKSGAKYLVLVGRSSPTQRAESIVGSLRETGTKVRVGQVDVADINSCIRMLEEIKQAGFPPLKGIMHAAGVLSNGEVRNMCTESFMKTFRAKIQGTWNVHSLTLDYNLDHFILFSSIITTMGGVGQANHSAANRYLNAFASYRTNLGLPCTSIGWGAWSEVGAAANMGGTLERVFGMKTFSPAQGIASLQRILLEHMQFTLISDVTDWSILTHTCRQGNLFDVVKIRSKTTRTSADLERKMKLVKEANPSDRLGLVKEFLEYVVRDTLKLSDSDTIDYDVDLKEVGIDSLMAMEIKSKLQDLLNDVDEKSLSVQAFTENRTINKLATFVTAIMNGHAEFNPLTREELLELVKKDSKLPDAISIKGITTACLPSQYKHVLLTGAAGQLGVYIIRELTTRRPDLSIYCLIRAESDALARERLESNLNSFDLFKSICLSNVICIAGSVSREQLAQKFYTELTMKVDAVIHCAAMMNHVLPYGEHDQDDLRSTNVLGLLNVLKFSVTGILKHVQHESFIGIMTEDSNVNGCLEHFPADDEWGEEFFQSGYLMSKFICEKLLKEAVIVRRLPITVVRHSHLTGDSKTGIISTRADHSMMIILASRKAKVFPDYDSRITMVPVNVSAHIAMSLFLHDKIEPGIYTITNPATIQMSEVVDMFKYKGYDFRLVPFNEWREAVLLSQKTELAPLAELYIKDLTESPLLAESTFAKRMKGDGKLLVSDKLKRYVPDVDELMPQPLDLIKLYISKNEVELD